MKGYAIINDKKIQFEATGGKHLLDFIRDDLQLKGTKEACREGDCGSCMVLLGKQENGDVRYKTINSCMFPVGEIQNSHIVTIEGLNEDRLTPIQQFMVDEWASQCGFCTPGFIVSMTGYFLQAKTLDVDEAIAFLGGNICRCTGYLSIKRAMTHLCESLDQDEFRKSYQKNRVNFLIAAGFLPGYFEHISALISELPVEDDPNPFEPGNVLMAGGTDLYIQKAEIISTQEPYFILRNSLFRGIRQEGDQCVIGSATTVSELEESDLFTQIVPQFRTYSRLISGASIRNRATVGGNIVNASPIGDLSILFLALNASIKLEYNGRKRLMPLKNFFLGYKKLDLYPGELVKELMIPMAMSGHGIHFEKVSRRTHLDIASVNSAMSIRLNKGKIEEIHASAGGVGPVPMYLNGFCHHLQDNFFDEKLMETGIQLALNEISPISDVRGSKTYKCLLLEQQLRIHFSVLAGQINKNT